MTRYFILTLILCGQQFTYAQYSVNKRKYDTRDYYYQTGDPYNPIVCGAASYLLPGLGQMVAGEKERGLIFTSIFAAGFVTAITGFIRNPLYPGPTEIVLLATGMTVCGGAFVWSIVDAVKVAKINNLAYRDKKKTSNIIYLQPCFVDNRIENRHFIGASLKVRF